LSAEMLTDWVS